jgi:hypothetical protein
MSHQYSPRQFLRQTTNCLLQEYFHRRNFLRDIDPFPGNEAQITRVFEAFQALPQNQRQEVSSDNWFSLSATVRFPRGTTRCHVVSDN